MTFAQLAQGFGDLQFPKRRELVQAEQNHLRMLFWTRGKILHRLRRDDTQQVAVDAILTQKIDECLDNGIVLDMKVEIPSHIMREEDTCEVFGSILDFAVAVSNKQPTDKKIKIVLQDQDNKLKVFVTANAAVFDSVDATRMTEIEQSTTKILSAYNGIVSAQHDEDQSTITWNLLIPLPQDNEWLASYIYDSSEALSSGVRTVKQ